jgi:stage V sporulation protein G
MSESLNFKVERLYRLEGDGVVKAFADVAINDAILLKGLRVIKGEKGLFVSMPKMQGKDQKWYEMVKPLNKEVQAQIAKAVLDSYRAEK